MTTKERREFIKGNEAVVKGAILAGCTHYFGYPITPASEIAHAAALYMPKVGGTFLQAESEVAAINMVYGAASCGRRVMTASSGPGISLKQEGVSYIAGANLPCVIIDVMRAGPGLGNIWPEQGDYNQVVKGGGHGNYKTIVLAPNSAQEMCDLTVLAFDLADKWLTPVYVLADAYVGQMMEPVTFPDKVKKSERKPWAIYADKDSKHNLVTSIIMSCEGLEKVNLDLVKKYEEIEKSEVRCEEFQTSDAKLVLVAYGISSRLSHTTVEILRSEGCKVGLFRPVTLFPFPKKEIRTLAEKVQAFMSIELSSGQMAEDIRLTLNGKRPVEYYGRMGGMVPSVDELVTKVRDVYKKMNS